MHLNIPYDKLTEYFVNENGITENSKWEIFSIPARQLIKPERIDLMAKWIYIDAFVKGVDMEPAKQLYIKHIAAFSEGTYTEPGTEIKNSIEKYLSSFNELIINMRDHGFDSDISLIPIGRDNVLLDGSHRCSIAAYFDQQVSAIRFPELYKDYGTNFFRKRQLDIYSLDWMSLQYCYLHENLYMACLWPKTNTDKRAEAIQVIEKECGKIVYCKTVQFSYKGLHNFMVQIYGHQAWVGTVEDGHKGADEKVSACYDNSATTIVLFHCDSLESVLNVKEKIRNIFKLGKHSVHISDTIQETRQMADIILNANSCNLMNYGNVDKHLVLNRKLQNIIKSTDYNKILMLADATMDIYGIGNKKSESISFCNIDDDSSIQGQSKDLIKMFTYPGDHLTYSKVKFVSLNNAAKIKANEHDWGNYIRIKIQLSREHRKKFNVSNKRFNINKLYKKEKVSSLYRIKYASIHFLEKFKLLDFVLKIYHLIKK